MNDAYRVVGSVDKARNRKSGDAPVGFFAHGVGFDNSIGLNEGAPRSITLSCPSKSLKHDNSVEPASCVTWICPVLGRLRGARRGHAFDGPASVR